MLRRHTYLAALVLALAVIAPGVSNGADPTPVGWWTFDDGTPGDISGNGLDGVLLGDAAIVADPERGQVLQINESGMQDASGRAVCHHNLFHLVSLGQARSAAHRAVLFRRSLVDTY